MNNASAVGHRTEMTILSLSVNSPFLNIDGICTLATDLGVLILAITETKFDGNMMMLS